MFDLLVRVYTRDQGSSMCTHADDRHVYLARYVYAPYPHSSVELLCGFYGKSFRVSHHAVRNQTVRNPEKNPERYLTVSSGP